MSINSKRVSIIIPTKDEPHIQWLIKKIHATLSNLRHEIIIVDKSKIIPKLRGVKLIRQKTDGLGKAVLEGLKIAKGGIIITMDGDGSHRPEDLPKLIEKTKDLDIVIGSRYVKGGKTKDKPLRVLISRFYCLLTSLILNLKIKDSMSGFVAVKREVWRKVNPNPRGFKVNTELLFKAKKFGFKTVEIPIIFKRRKFGKSKGALLEGMRTLSFILELRFGLR